jgi:murein DD-endopeptidase MepM/ murein hydrolase activator NlpD
MPRISLPATLFAVVSSFFVWSCVATPVLAASPEEERLLGCGCEDAQLQSYLPFTRAIGVSGVVKDGLARSAAEAGVPPAAMLELTKDLATVIDLDRDVRDGDRFYVRYERPFTAAGAPLEVGRVLWAEIKTAAKGTFALHRFRPAGATQDTLWLTSGEGTGTPELEMPLASIAVTSGFGMRADPVDQPWGHGVAMGPIGSARPVVGGRWHPPVALRPSPLITGAAAVNAPTPLGLSMGLIPKGVDLVAAVGTPVYAAGDGVVLGAEPKGRYGNWIEIDHANKLSTVYGHLSAFAPGIVAGARVTRGELIGFTGSTGRVTGPHLHFEIRVDGRPTNPIGNPAIKHAQLRGVDLQQFRKIVADDVAERERESKSM